MRRSNGYPLLILVISLLLPNMLVSSLLADEPESSPPKSSELRNQAVLLEFARRHQIETVDQPATVLELRATPVLAWTNPTRGDVFGGIFLWVDGQRPLAYGGMFVWRDQSPQKLGREFHSLTSQPLVASFNGQPIWSPRSDAFTFHSFSNADSAYASTPVRRLRQFKQFANRFSATIIGREGNSEKTRMLPTPIYRYADAESGIIDAAIFAFVQGNDPEALLLLKLHSAKLGEAKWQYGVARCTTWALEVELDGAVIDSRPRYDFSLSDSTAAFVAIPRISIE